jgi:nicotinamidase-related amidase
MAHVLPSGGGKALMNAEDSVLLLLDHQSGLFQTVKDITVAELRANVGALARIATLLKLPVITTASVPEGPNGPLMPETVKLAPHAVYVPRHGEVNGWTTTSSSRRSRRRGRRRSLWGVSGQAYASCFRHWMQRLPVLMSTLSWMHPAIRPKWYRGQRLHVSPSLALYQPAQMQ